MTGHSTKSNSRTAAKETEQPASHSKLFPRVYNRAAIQQKLKQLVKPIDAHPQVVELGNMLHVPWAAASIT